MMISELINGLDKIRNKYGDLPIFIYYDGDEKEPRLEIISSKIKFNEKYEAVEIPTETRCHIK